MNRKIATLGLLGTLLLTAVACDSGDDSTDAAPKDPATKESAPKKPEAPSTYPSPNAAQTAKLITALGAIDKGLVVKEDRAVRRSENVCRDIKDGKDAQGIKKNAELRFEGGNVPDLSDAQAGQIVDAVKASFCK
ncbi:hypothetical protein [Streptomyces luteogriseus]|uniref:hypothetical protein n=1 Tax=Streptomyces luteogriseus TaxID=68233 RepID=UPI0037A06C4E